VPNAITNFVEFNIVAEKCGDRAGTTRDASPPVIVPGSPDTTRQN
jgi:hypothetical protein